MQRLPPAGIYSGLCLCTSRTRQHLHPVVAVGLQQQLPPRQARAACLSLQASP